MIMIEWILTFVKQWQIKAGTHIITATLYASIVGLVQNQLVQRSIIPPYLTPSKWIEKFQFLYIGKI